MKYYIPNWATSTAYSTDDAVVYSGINYKCVIPHTSGVFSTDLAANKWAVLAVGDQYASPVRSEFYRDHYFAVDLVEIQLGTPNNLYLATGGVDIAYDSPTAPDGGSNVYTCQGDFMGFSGMSEDFDVKVGKFSIYLSAIGNSYVTKFVGQSVEGKRVCVYKAFLEPTGLTIVQAPILMFDGTIFNVSINETSRSCQLTLDCSSLFADFERTAGRKTNNWSNWLYQGDDYDTAMEKASFVGQIEFKWGKL